MKFTKMQGLGNDYLYFYGDVEKPEELSVKLSDRHFGVGSDGIILILPSKLPTSGCEFSMQTAVRPKCAETAYAVWENTSMTRAIPTRQSSVLKLFPE